MQNQTPAKLALIQLVESILITAFIAGILSISAAVTGTGPVNLKDTGIAFALAFLFSLAHSLAAYLKALPAPGQVGQPDLSSLGSVLEGLVTAIQQKMQSPLVVIHQPAATTVASVTGGPTNPLSEDTAPRPTV